MDGTIIIIVVTKATKETKIKLTLSAHAASLCTSQFFYKKEIKSWRFACMFTYLSKPPPSSSSHKQQEQKRNKTHLKCPRSVFVHLADVHAALHPDVPEADCAV